MKRHQVVLCAIATVATLATFFFVGWWFYKTLVTVALSLVVLAFIALSF